MDLTEFATIAENTGVEVRRDSRRPPLPRTLIADVASFPHAMPTSIEPTTTDLLVAPKSRFSFSRARLMGWGTLAFCAGVLASAGVHMFAAPSRVHLGPSANAATSAAAPAPSTPMPAPVQATAPAAAPVAPVAAVAAPAPAVEAPAANTTAPDTARTEAPHLAMAAGAASVRTRSGATAQARGQMRARGRIRSRSGSVSAAEVAGETDAPASDEPAAPAAKPAHPAAGWVDPFAQ